MVDGLDSTKRDGLELSMQLNDSEVLASSFSSQLQTKRKRSKRSSWEVDSYLRDLVHHVEFIAEELDNLLGTVLPELCRLAREFSELPEPKRGQVKVRARGREYEYSVLYLYTDDAFTHARKIYLTNERRRELASKYETIYRRIADLLKAARTYCLEHQDTAKQFIEDPRTSSNSLETSIELNEDLEEEF